jgi:hypothetical protein
MEPAIANQLVGTFVKFVGETLAELKSKAVVEVDLDLLRLNRDVLVERLEDLESKVVDAVKSQKGNAIADLSSRGLLNSSMKDSTLLAIDRDANQQLDVARREHNRAIEEIALMERRIRERMAPCFKRLWRWLRK